jgi:hypothetical protein
VAIANTTKRIEAQCQRAEQFPETIEGLDETSGAARARRGARWRCAVADATGRRLRKLYEPANPPMHDLANPAFRRLLTPTQA